MAEDEVIDEQSAPVAVEGQGAAGEASTSLLDQVFGADPFRADEQPVDDDLTGQAGVTEQDDETPDQADQPQAQAAPAPPVSTAGAEDGLVEVDLGDKGKVKVPAAVAEAYQAQARDYKNLQAEFTRRNQAQKGEALGGPKAGEQAPDAGAARDSAQGMRDVQATLADFDQRLYKAAAEDDGKGMSTAVMDLIHWYGQGIIQPQINEQVAKAIEPLLLMLQSTGVADQALARKVERVAAPLAQELGVEVDDYGKLYREAQAIAQERGQGKPSEAELQLALIKRFKAASRTSVASEPEPKPASKQVQVTSYTRRAPAAPQGGGFLPGGQAKTANTGRQIMHRNMNDLAGM